VPPETDLLLLVQIELPPGLSSAEAYEQIGAEGDDAAGDTALGRFCRVLRAHDAFENAEIALADNTRRVQQMLAFRESAPTGVNHRVAQAKRLDARIDKTAADMVVPFAHFETMMAIYHDGYERRGLDYAIWGHISDGNVHPNVIPRSYEDVIAGRDAILEFGREVARLGGSPLAEHGVGRSALKQQLLRVLYGDGAIDDMRAIKRALDPEWKLSPGVLFSADLSSSH
jgi:D-lactate dehydrogenase (cytochrome)